MYSCPQVFVHTVYKGAGHEQLAASIVCDVSEKSFLLCLSVDLGLVDRPIQDQESKQLKA